MNDTTTTARQAVRRFQHQVPFLPRALRMVWQAAPGWTSAWILLLVVQGLLPVAIVYLTRAIVDSIVVVVDSGGSSDALQLSLIFALLLAIVLLAQTVLSSLYGWVRTAQSELIQDALREQIHSQALALDMRYYDSADYYDQLYRARVNAINRPMALLENIGSLLQSSITLTAMMGVLLPYGLWLPIALLISTLPALYAVVNYSWRQHRWQMANTSRTRRSDYLDWMISDRDAAPELRLFNLGETFRTSYRELRGTLRREQLDLERGQVVAQSMAGVFGLLVLGAAMVWMIWQISLGVYSLGDLALFYAAFNQGQSLMRVLLQNVAQIYTNMLFLENLFDFLDLKPTITAPLEPVPVPATLAHGISMEKVSFCYPGSEIAALRDFDLYIPAGQSVAIVGENGAGKSTLVKLLCRFFDPDSGRVCLDGTDLRHFDPSRLLRLFSVMFQQPVEYHDTAANNIAFGDLAAKPNRAEIEWAATASGADIPIRNLPAGYDTLLGKWFGDAELSVGEWQRIALARAFLRQAPIMVLDEPTSAMDSWAESDWLARFRKLASGRTTILITHRFTTAMQADVIHVMVDGRVVESGDHQQLLELGGRYATSWHAQMREGAG